MSFPKTYRLVTSPRAERDLEHILRYTSDTWGESQLAVYQQLLDNAIRVLRQNPTLGHRSADLSKTHLVYPVGSHVIVYRVLGDLIGIVRVLHQRMSVSLHV